MPGAGRAKDARMSLGELAGIGLGFVTVTLLGFGAGLLLARQTGASWWVVAGLLAGVAAGAALSLRRMLRTLH